MSKNNQKKNVAAKSASKKEAILKSETKSQSPLRTLLVMAMVVIGGLAFYLFQS